MYGCFACIFVCAYIPGGQKRVLDALKLELHTLEAAGGWESNLGLGSAFKQIGPPLC